MLVINGLSKKYKTGRGIFGMSIAIKAGEVYGLLGPNGAGKTTLLKVIAGLLSPTDGTCLHNGVDVINAPTKYKSHMIGMIGDTVLYDYLTPLEHMEMMRIHRPDMTLLQQEAVLDKLGLLAYKNEKTKQFSTGMKQRLAFAMCLITEAKVLLLDEPFSGLDIEGKLLIRDCLAELRDQGETAMILSSHLIHDLEEVVTKVGVVKGGYLIDEEDVAYVQRHYRNLEAYFIGQTVTVKEGA